jgi:hypothetical protein
LQKINSQILLKGTLLIVIIKLFFFYTSLSPWRERVRVRVRRRKEYKSIVYKIKFLVIGILQVL